MTYVVTDGEKSYFIGTFEECDEWLFHHAKEDIFAEYETWFYNGKEVYIEETDEELD